MKIILAPDPILSQPSKPVGKIDSSVLKIIEKMKKALNLAKDPEGVGLAAPQIGVPIRIFIAKPAPKGKTLVFLNPKIKSLSELKEQTVVQSKKTEKAKARAGIKKGQQLEGCLSLKDIWGTVKRSPKVLLSYTDENGQTHEKEFKNFMATIVQHEYDHLNGILFPRRVLEQKGKLYKSLKDEKGEDIFEEIELP